MDGKLRREKVFAVLPTMLTLGNAACGFGAITFAAKVGPDTAGGGGGELFVAAMLIFLAMLFDALDGSVARLTDQTSEFGAQLDSLCDAISFGVAPAFLMLQFIHPGHGQNLNLLEEMLETNNVSLVEYPRELLWVIACLYVVCALLRLARFNVETDEDDSHGGFSGLPSPAAAGTIASFPIAIRGIVSYANNSASRFHDFACSGITLVAILLPLITLAVALLMVSRFEYTHVFNQFFKGKRTRAQLLQVVFAIAMIALVKEIALPVICCGFAFSAPVRSGWRQYVVPARKRLPEEPTA